MNARFLLVGSILATSLFLPGRAPAQTFINPAGGSFHEASNWSTGQIPTPGNDVVFDLDADYSVELTSDVHVQSTLASGGEVTLDLGGAHYFVSEALAVHGTSNGGPANPTFSTRHGSIEAGQLSVRDGTFEHVGQLTVGEAAFSHTLLERAVVRNSGVMAIGPSGTSQFTLSSSQFENLGGVRIGDNDSNFQMTNSTLQNFGDFRLTQSGVGQFRVANSSIVNFGTLRVGGSSASPLDLQSGSLMNAGEVFAGHMNIGEAAASSKPTI
jgi:hypothetical protein